MSDQIVTLLVLGAPRTKKNHGSVIQRNTKTGPRRFHIPSEPFTRWQTLATIHSPCGVAFPLPAQPYNCAAVFYRDADRGDAVGYYQGLADFLEARGIVLNDKWITQWDGSRLLVDRERPRVELVLSPVVGAGGDDSHGDD